MVIDKKIFLCLATVPITEHATAQVKQQRPNIIIIMCDDMGYSDIGCFGSEIRTPHLDKMAEQGMQLTQFYANPRSCPTRASLLTGMYPTNAGIGQMDKDFGIPEYQGYLRNDCLTIGEVMGANDYETYMSGKWHVGAKEGQWPADRGFDHSWVFLGGATDYYEPKSMVINHEHNKITDPNFYMTDAISKNAVKYIKEHNFEKKPLFMYVAYTAPHWPLQAPQKLINKYKKYYKRGWDAVREERMARLKKKGVIPNEADLSDRHHDVPEWNAVSTAEQKDWQTKMAIYAAMIDAMDTGIGQIITELDRQGESDNTLIMFLADNGACPFPVNFGKNDPSVAPGAKGSSLDYGIYGANASCTPFKFFKRWTHEGGINVPAIVKYPNLIKGRQINHSPAHVIDLMPTCIELGGGKYPTTYKGRIIRPMDGVSMIPLLRGGTTLPYKTYCWEHNGNKAIRKGDWKLLYNNDKGAKCWELYNVAKDRTEIHDLALQYPDKVEQLAKEYQEWVKRTKVIPFDELRKMNQTKKKK